MTSQSQGIQQLLQAEKRAKDKLEEAKKSKHLASGKGKRLKQAKEEAIAEIDHYRLQREKEFRNKQTNVMGSQGNLSAKIEEQTTETIQKLTSSYHKNKESMMKKLLNMIYDINPEVHPNFRHAA
ncbi:V-type proton ATPase subunit G 3 isoform X2 [Cygnus atratus]|uniref:V-type proton ATPase subunit G 3 isoform X2 n=1 Tax=Cygnus atratus TaxID=8868 RepID=UPI0015D5EC25|nr:V-type proton ATPase subunit G 3 isoform X2 [Cygnus atratus]